jgi:serine protease Do
MTYESQAKQMQIGNMFPLPLIFLAVSAIMAQAQTAQAQTVQPPAPPAPPKLRGRSVTIHPASRRGYLGVGVADISAERAKTLKVPGDVGVEVKHVEDNSPAAKAGLKEGDVILDFNDKKFDDMDGFIAMVAESGPGTKATLSVWRNGLKQKLTATLESRPITVYSFSGSGNGADNSGWLVPPIAPMPNMPAMPNIPAMPGDAWAVLTGQAPRIGFEGEALTPQLAEYFGVKEGVLVRTVVEKTAASKAGLKAGDVIFKVNGTPVASTREISGMVRAARKNVAFTVMRNHKEIVLNVEIAENRTPSPQREAL